MLVVDLDPDRRQIVAAWKDGDAVSERTYSIDDVVNAAATKAG